MPDFAAAAGAYAAKGVPVFPCAPRAKLPAIRKWDGLPPEPAEGWKGRGVSEASTDPALIAAWWKRFPAANIGLACGHGVWVLDIDQAAAAGWLADQLLIRGEGLPETAVVQTRSGMHFYWSGDAPPKNGAPARIRHPEGRLAGRDGYLRVEGLDTRVRGGYVLAPPSVHPSGHVYDWAADADGIVRMLDLVQPAPGWLVEALSPWPAQPEAPAEPRRRRVAEPDADRQRQRALRYLDAACKAIEAAPLGQRHQTLRDASLRVGGLVKNGHLGMAEARAAIEAAGRAGSARHGGRWDQSRVQTMEDSLKAGTAWSPGERRHG